MNVIVPETVAPSPGETSAPAPSPTPAGPECGTPKSRTSDGYWTHIDACGCASLDAPSRASQGYERFTKACSQWRQRNPTVNVIVTRPSPSPRPSPRPRTGS